MFSHSSLFFLLKINRILCVKSAVLFFIVSCLSACDPKPIQSKSDAQITTSTLSIDRTPTRELLTRGVYHDLLVNPHSITNTEQNVFLRDLLEGLTAYDAMGNIIPAVAQSWQTEDYKTWIFLLRDGIRWSNGDLLSAQDFVASWQALARSNSQLKSYLRFLNLANSQAVIEGNMAVDQLGVEAVAENILRIQLDKPTPHLPAMLAHVVLLPNYQKQTSEFIGNGAYRLVNQQGNLIHLEKNYNYWASEKVSFKFVDYQKLNNTESVSDLDIVFEPKNLPIEIQYFPQLCTYYYEFNLADPLLKRHSVRKALTSMISSRRIVQDVAPQMQTTTHFLPHSMRMESDLAWQPVVMEQLLEQNGITEKSPLQLKLTYDQDNLHNNIAQRLVRMWSQSDMIRISAEPVSRQQLLEKREKGDFQLIRSGWCADYNEPSAFLHSFYSYSPDNNISYRNADIDKLLETTLRPQPEAERQALYAQIAEQLQQENVVLPIFQYTKPIFIHSTIVGYHTNNPTGIIYSKDLYRKVNSK
ncbi:peptide ABC transporter substrate-binding protein [Pasteurella canis]|uniref:peptide ABC transporter substrate-binding protein n=1 Tax=Pasteurella canis TaxID=753 RepID=UPI001CC0DD73|nr:peptide ABC transporter substrate-binding protein [Pasteurella canis]UAX42969.1 peptide ABC transporter substrate-binding protein [Pasteurella canis]